MNEVTTAIDESASKDRVLLRTAAHLGTPSYVYFESVLRERVSRLREKLSRVPGQLLYAMKANSHPVLLGILRDEGLGVDAVSPAELLLAIRVGFEPSQVLYSANNMTDAEMHFAHRQGVLLNIGELSRLDKYGEAYPGSRVCVRLNPQIGAGHHQHVITAGERSKFGIPVAQCDQVVKIAKRHGLRIEGLHQHIGSGILDTETLWKAIEVLLDEAPRIPGVRFLNLGGGLGIPYRPDEQPIDLENFEHRIVQPLLAWRAAHGNRLDFWFEPGRFFTAEAGVLLVRVNTIKDTGTRRFAGVDSGMMHLLRPALYDAYHPVDNLSNPDGTPQIYDVVGNICESADFFARDRSIPEIREGDVLAIRHTGAYGMSMASDSYNLRPLPAEALVTSEEPDRYRVLRRRETPAELVARVLRDVEPTGR